MGTLFGRPGTPVWPVLVEHSGLNTSTDGQPSSDPGQTQEADNILRVSTLTDGTLFGRERGIHLP